MSDKGSEIDDLVAPLVSFRRDLHAHPELAYEERRTSRKIEEALRQLGLEVHTGIGGALGHPN